VPIYEYECSDCQVRFERKQSFDEEPVAICPECQGKARRVIRSIPVIFLKAAVSILPIVVRVWHLRRVRRNCPARKRGRKRKVVNESTTAAGYHRLG
jgi:putative FmdB family regulatory protein